MQSATCFVANSCLSVLLRVHLVGAYIMFARSHFSLHVHVIQSRASDALHLAFMHTELCIHRKCASLGVC